MSLAKKLASVPLEYQASVYAKQMKLSVQRKQDKDRKTLLNLLSEFASLKKTLRATEPGESREKVQKQTADVEKLIKKVRRPKRKWSPILPGSFEASKR